MNDPSKTDTLQTFTYFLGKNTKEPKKKKWESYKRTSEVQFPRGKKMRFPGKLKAGKKWTEH